MSVGTFIDRPALRGLQLGRHVLGLSNMKVTLSPLSSALRVMMSSFPAHLSILDMFPKFMPVRSSFVRVGQLECSSRCFFPASSLSFVSPSFFAPMEMFLSHR